jgi:amino acid transporter
MAAAAQSQAPIGDLMRLFGDSLLGGLGFGLSVTMAVTVGLAILGTTLSCVNTAVRISYAMAKDKEMPEVLGLVHGRFATPSAATWVLVAVSAVIGSLGVYSVVTQTGISIASNLGTFILYALICVWTLIAFSGRPERNMFLHVLVPGAGLVMNLLMVVTIFYLAFAAGGASAAEGWIALGVAAAWAVVSGIYYAVRTARRVPVSVLEAG